MPPAANVMLPRSCGRCGTHTSRRSTHWAGYQCVCASMSRTPRCVTGCVDAAEHDSAARVAAAPIRKSRLVIGRGWPRADFLFDGRTHAAAADHFARRVRRKIMQSPRACQATQILCRELAPVRLVAVLCPPSPGDSGGVSHCAAAPLSWELGEAVKQAVAARALVPNRPSAAAAIRAARGMR